MSLGDVSSPSQLACAPITSQEGQDYLKAMAAGANFAFVNRSSITYLIRQAFSKVFNSTPDDLDMQVIYDVSHNIAKVWTLVAGHSLGGGTRRRWQGQEAPRPP